ncbi:hypothetical protein QUF64_03885 [Anaerolineales bacterium HSG6]|nr:hypothetical protein [Anaerolineales bacterium HSG6]
MVHNSPQILTFFWPDILWRLLLTLFLLTLLAGPGLTAFDQTINPPTAPSLSSIQYQGGR